MPELPEVEVTRIGLLSRLPGRRITKISHSNKRLRLPMPRKLLTMHVRGNTIITIDRRAKYLLFRIAGGTTMIIHLGMTGKLGLISPQTSPAPHDHLRLLLDNGMELRFNDARRFGCVMVWPPMDAEDMEAAFSARIGVEPLSKDFNAPYLQQQSRLKKIALKKFLMDSRILAGIGNIYANEILFAASVHPETPACSVTPHQWKAIISSTRRILRKAIRAGGSTISDFLGSSGNPGYFQVHFNVYNRTGEECKQCKNTISRTVIGGRATFFCPQCQPVKTGG
jgi:formamidopyrimidine-DNA glycosylase